jgi:endonuclease/exonuclease/phosphatase family metal-dependent hydrolase
MRAVGLLVVALLLVLLDGYRRVPTNAAAGDGLAEATRSSNGSAENFRVGTFNIDGGVGTDGKLDLTRIAQDMKECDVVGLQEVHGRTLLEPRDQACILGDQLHLPFLFAPAERQWWHDSFGNGVVSKLACGQWERLPITGDAASNHRCLLRVDVHLNSSELRVLIVHLPTTNDRASQCAIVQSMFMDLAEPVLLLGDLNCKPGDAWIEKLRHMPGVVDGVGKFSESAHPQHVDWILSRGLNCIAGGAVDHGSSDHPFFWNEFSIWFPVD